MAWNSTPGGGLAIMLVGAPDHGVQDCPLASPAQTHALLDPQNSFQNLNTLRTHKDQISHRNSNSWLLWKTEDPASGGPHGVLIPASEQGPSRGGRFRTGADVPPACSRLLTPCLPGGQLICDTFPKANILILQVGRQRPRKSEAAPR